MSGINYSCVSHKWLGAVGGRFEFKHGAEKGMGFARKVEQLGQSHDTMKAQLKVELTIGE
jgi:predicted Mrr-cat superfamily restriction endonuclease